MWPFTRTPFLAEEYSEWILQAWSWLIENCGGYEQLKSTPLITPTREYFPNTDLQGHDFFVYMFEKVQKLSGLEDRPCVLEPHYEDEEEAPPHPAQGLTQYQTISGTFSEDEETGTARITYDPALRRQPMALVATFVHELAHYKLHRVENPPPGGWEMSELATDLAAVFMGFGIFQANSAFSFQQFTDGTTVGWKSSSRGYLSAPSLLFALAIFVMLTGADPKKLERHLNSDLVGRYRGALKHAHGLSDRIEAMKNISGSSVVGVPRESASL